MEGPIFGILGYLRTYGFFKLKYLSPHDGDVKSRVYFSPLKCS